MDENSNSDIRFRLSKSLRSQPNLRGKRRKKTNIRKGERKGGGKEGRTRKRGNQQSNSPIRMGGYLEYKTQVLLCDPDSKTTLPVSMTKGLYF